MASDEDCGTQTWRPNKNTQPFFFFLKVESEVVLILIFTAKPILWRIEAFGAFAIGSLTSGEKAFTAVHAVMCPFHFLGLAFSAVGLDVGKLS